MRKILQVLLIAVLYTCAIKNTAAGQYGDKNYLVSVDKIKDYLDFVDKLKVEDAFDPRDMKANARALKANFRATENFKRQFKGADAVKWSVNDEVLVASFTKDEVKTNVVYDKAGRWINTLKYSSDEKTTPDKIRSLMGDMYPGFDITLCVEVYESNLVFHIVQIENKKTFKKLGIYDGEVNILSQYNKNQQ